MANEVPRPPGGRRIPAVLWDAAVEAQRVRNDAAQEATALLEQARAEVGSLRARAAEAGRAEGLAQVQALVAGLVRARDRAIAEAEPQLIELAFSIAQRVLGRAVERDPEAVVQVARRAVAAARRQAELRVHAHPDDLAALRGAEPPLAEGAGLGKRLTFVADDLLERGGVRVETALGVVDASLESQLGALRRAADGGRRDAP